MKVASLPLSPGRRADFVSVNAQKRRVQFARGSMCPPFAIFSKRSTCVGSVAKVGGRYAMWRSVCQAVFPGQSGRHTGAHLESQIKGCPDVKNVAVHCWSHSQGSHEHFLTCESLRKRVDGNKSRVRPIGRVKEFSRKKWVPSQSLESTRKEGPRPAWRSAFRLRLTVLTR